MGNEEYSEEHGSMGLTTMRRSHLEQAGDHLVFSFPGKGGKELEVELTDGRSARAIRRCLDLPGECVFQHESDEGSVPITSADVNESLEEVTPGAATAKDFRTWGGTAETVRWLGPDAPPDDERDRQRVVLDAVDAVAGRLGNTRAV